MNYSIDKSSAEPAYLQLYKQLRSDIARNVYPAESRLPSKRLLASELGLSLITVEHAYALLCDEGYARSKERSGYFAAFRAGDSFLSGAAAPTVAVSDAQTAPQQTDFPFSVFAKAMRAVLTDCGTQTLQPTPPQGLLSLRDALSRYLLRSRGIQAAPAQIVIGAGAEYLYRLIAELFGRDCLFAIETPSYPKIEQVYRSAGVRLERLPLGADGIKTAALQKSNADVLHVSPYRGAPDRIRASASKRAAYLHWASQGERYIVEDDFDSEFSVAKKAEETLFAHTHQNRVLYLNTFSGTISPALRVAYLVLPPQLADPFQKKLGFYSCTVPTYLQLVLERLLSGGDFERHINRVRRQKRRALGL
ncbi:MAG: PLP-dependent aminotransferase family protein [Clostridia bacterium]|nr:PLP-dependent aminotransferase family protein [Clostridia bacterium]